MRLVKKIKGLITLLVGAFICVAPLLGKFRAYLRSTWFGSESRSKLNSVLFQCYFKYWTHFVYLKEPDPEKRETMKNEFMGGFSGVQWAEYYASNPIDLDLEVGNISLAEANPLFVEIPQLLRSLSDQDGLKLIQIGSSSGKELHYFAKQFPNVTCVGFDIDPAICEFSNTRFGLSNCHFEYGLASNIESFLSDKGTNIIFSSSSVQYVQSEHLDVMFQALSKQPKTWVMLLEPADSAKGDPSQIKGSKWRVNFSYTHDYRHYAEKAGLHTQKCQIIKPYLDRSTVHYYYLAKTVPVSFD